MIYVNKIKCNFDTLKFGKIDFILLHLIQLFCSYGNDSIVMTPITIMFDLFSYIYYISFFEAVN